MPAPPLQQPLVNVVKSGDNTMDVPHLQLKRTALQTALTALDTISLASHFAGAENGARIVAAQATFRSLVAAEVSAIDSITAAHLRAHNEKDK